MLFYNHKDGFFMSFHYKSERTTYFLSFYYSQFHLFAFSDFGIYMWNIIHQVVLHMSNGKSWYFTCVSWCIIASFMFLFILASFMLYQLSFVSFLILRNFKIVFVTDAQRRRIKWNSFLKEKMKFYEYMCFPNLNYLPASVPKRTRTTNMLFYNHNSQKMGHYIVIYEFTFFLSFYMSLRYKYHRTCDFFLITFQMWCPLKNASSHRKCHIVNINFIWKVCLFEKKEKYQLNSFGELWNAFKHVSKPS